MITVNKIQVPSAEAQDCNKNQTIWRNGLCILIDEGPSVTLFLAHENETIVNEDGEEEVITRAFPIRVSKPVTRAKAINAAEMEAYQLTSALGVASLSASLSRKFREDPSDAECKEHDQFIARVKQELNKIGLISLE